MSVVFSPLGVNNKWRCINVVNFGTATWVNKITISGGRYVYSVISEYDLCFDVTTFDGETKSIYHCCTIVPSKMLGRSYYFSNGRLPVISGP